MQRSSNKSASHQEKNELHLPKYLLRVPATSDQINPVSSHSSSGPATPSKRPQSAMASYAISRPPPKNFRGVPNSISLPTLEDGVCQENSRSANVKVVVRVRPFLHRETQQDLANLISMDSTTTTINAPPQSQVRTSSRAAVRRNVEAKSFTFDNSFWSCNPNDPTYVNQKHVYASVGREFLDHNMEGYHTCIFAYGQTGSGKSYTMMGNDTDPGLIPRTCQDLFERIENMTSTHFTCTVRVSYFEVYNEMVRDLLAPSKEANIPNHQPQHKLRVRESPTEGPYVEDLSEFSVKTASEVLKYLSAGNKARVTAATKMNDVSSRSHAVFTLVVKQVITDPVTDATEEKTSRIRLVDLAGSERANSTGATGQRLREGSNINKSLTTLGRVIAALADSSTEASSNGRASPVKRKSGSSQGPAEGVIPYRDSVLTWLLKDSLGGNSKTAMVACISPTDYDETLSTLRYADQAKSIQTRAVVNQDIVSAADRDKLLAEMQDRINSLQSSLMQQQQQERGLLEFEKVKSAIRFYEDKAISEESRRKAIQTENAAVKRHNKLLIEHLKEVTNKTIGNMQVVVDSKVMVKSKGGVQERLDEQSEFSQEAEIISDENEPPSLIVVPAVNYDILQDELQELLIDFRGFSDNLRKDISFYSQRVV